jgi:hypothetical protein
MKGSWTDPVDLNDDGPSNDEHDGHVFSRRIGYDEANASIPNVQEQGVLPPRHEFGDTKHRLVSYRAIGTTRYREYFPASVTADPKNITTEGDKFPELNILSSARPDVPRVLYIVPTFRWERSSNGLTSTRVGRGLRIYLDRPWYSSGAGELLGILLLHAPVDLATMETIRPYVSEWGVDPAGDDVPPTTELQASHFTNQAITPIDNVAVAEKPDLLVRVAGFNVEYNPDRKLWFCDVEMNPGNLYFPFVRLAITRLQPDSVQGPEDVRLSHVVKTEFAQLTADRTATLHPTAKGVDVTVSGLTSHNEVGTKAPVPVVPPLPLPIVQPLPLPVHVPVIGTDVVTTGPVVVTPSPSVGGTTGKRPAVVYTPNPQAGRGHVLRAHVERRRASTRADGKEALGWNLVGSELTLASYTRGAAPEVFWRGTVAWTDRDPTYKYRLVICESELLNVDNGLGDRPPSEVMNPVGERLVYLDTIPLAI